MAMKTGRERGSKAREAGQNWKVQYSCMWMWEWWWSKRGDEEEEDARRKKKGLVEIKFGFWIWEKNWEREGCACK